MSSIRRRLLIQNALKPYLLVSPKDVQWILDDSDLLYNVESNVDWVVNETEIDTITSNFIQNGKSNLVERES